MRWRRLLGRDLLMRLELYVLVGMALLLGVAYVVRAVVG
jgi:hypothetical protein